MLAGKRVVVTGGTGSFGKVIVRRLLEGEMGLPDDRGLLARRGEPASDAAGLPASPGRHRRDRLQRNATAAGVPGRRHPRPELGRLAASRDRRRLQRSRDEAGPDVRVLPVRGGEDQHRRGREHRPGDPRPRARSRDGVGVSTDKAVQARERDGDDQGRPGADPGPGRTSSAPDTVRRRPLWQRARVARLGGPALPRADPKRRPGHDHHPGHDPLPAQPRPGRGHGLRRPPRRAAPARPTSRFCRPRWSPTSPRH